MPTGLQRTLISGLLLCICTGPAHADKLDDNLQTVWESLWDQRGTPRQLFRWDKAIRYRIHGLDSARHRAHIERALRAATEVAQLELIDVTEQVDGESIATLDIEVVSDSNLQDNEPCFTVPLKASNWAYNKVQVKMRSKDAWRCAFHEIMHVMGIAGHPSGKTVLSYFPYRRDTLMELDRLMLAAWYSPAMPKGATPLEALFVLSAAVAKQGDLDVPADEVVKRTDAFNQRMVLQLQAMATGQGGIPSIVMRSGKASHDFIDRSQPIAAYFVGLAYLKGVIVSKDAPASTLWFERAAKKSYSPAQVMLARALRSGVGTDINLLAAHAWLTAAANSGNTVARTELDALEKIMSPQELEQVKGQPLPQVAPV
jgi:hypothetical protein